jgi:3-oxoacyl-[acyl-carrier protein] reductase
VGEELPALSGDEQIAIKKDDHMKLENKVAIITGAGSGIGRAIALTFAKEGANIIVADIDVEAAKEVVEEVRSLGRQAHAIKVDVSNSEEVSQLANTTLANFKKIDILVNNAGITAAIPATEMTEAEWDKIINVCLKGQFLCAQAAGRQMIKQKQGKIINIGSPGGHFAQPEFVAYAAAKAGVLQLTKVLAVEWGKYNINVNTLTPGVTWTAMNERLQKQKPQYFTKYMERLPLKRFNKPEDIANAALFLASPESDNMTGQEIIVDMGICALHPGYVWPEK